MLFVAWYLLVVDLSCLRFVFCCLLWPVGSCGCVLLVVVGRCLFVFCVSPVVWWVLCVCCCLLLVGG